MPASRLIYLPAVAITTLRTQMRRAYFSSIALYAAMV
jgi:hypothetical protein